MYLGIISFIAIILFSVLLPSCATITHRESFVLPQGEAITCATYKQNQCGMNLKGCGIDKSVEFDCMTDIRYVGPDVTKPIVK